MRSRSRSGSKKKVSRGKKRNTSRGRKSNTSRGRISPIKTGKRIKIGYYLRNDATGAIRAPSIAEFNSINKKEFKGMMNMYAKPGWNIRVLGKQGNRLAVEILYNSKISDDIVPDLMLNPDDDGNRYIGSWGWHAKRML